jgi:hypothetical protein
MGLLNFIIQSDRRAAFATASLALLSLSGIVFLLWSGRTALIGPAYFASAVLIGGWLYTTASPLYLGFIVWIWFLTPFLRRVIDYATGTYTPPSRSLVLLTPFATTILTLLDIPRFGQQLIRRRYLPYFLCFLGVAYGYAIGLVKVGPFGATRQLLSWLPPLLTGFYVLNRWHLSEQHVHVIKRVMAWGVLVLGLYGIAQFYILPAWDAFWIRHAEMASIGQPYPQQVRLFSMLDSPGPFAVTMMTGLILLFTGADLFVLLAAVPGYVSFLLARVRGAWLGWLVAVGVLILQTTGRFRTRLLGTVAAIAVVTVPVVLTSGPIAQKTASRMETFENVEQDGSVQARMRLYRNAPFRIATNPIGWGLGSRSMDSGILTLFWQLGWPGGLLYLLGVGLLLRDVFRGSSFFTTIVMGIAASYALQFFAGGQLLSQISGVLFWSLTSLAIALELSQSSSPRRRVAT